MHSRRIVLETLGYRNRKGRNVFIECYNGCGRNGYAAYYIGRETAYLCGSCLHDQENYDDANPPFDDED